MSRLPRHFAKHAASIAAMNPLAFKDEASALSSMTRSYQCVRTHPATTDVSTGGYCFHKDGEGDIELWVSPDMVWKNG